MLFLILGIATTISNWLFIPVKTEEIFLRTSLKDIKVVSCMVWKHETAALGRQGHVVGSAYIHVWGA